jgi:phosphoribosylamine---glycine ligase
MKILLIGSGGREHAIAWKIAESPKVSTIFCAPGNGGTEIEYKCKNINITDIDELLSFAKKNQIDLTIVGPEEPLTKGIVDKFKAEDLKIFGPSQKGALLEGSKIFAKDFMKKYGVKTANYEWFYDYTNALDYIYQCKYPIVIKADGLAAGKGVIICNSIDEAFTALKDFMVKDTLKGSGKKIVIEEFLDGVEASILTITDGKTAIPLISAKDHKQLLDNNLGPNTGGMGAVAPNPYFTKEVLDEFERDILQPTLKGIAEEKLDFTGIIFFGVMINQKGVYLLEYNVRMGDPETQAVLSLMETDFTQLLLDAVHGSLDKSTIKWKAGSSCCIVAVSGGYPDKYISDYEITIDRNIKSKVFVAGAERSSGKLKTTGGRVLALTSIGENLDKAIKNAYNDIINISFKDMYYRKDIGKYEFKR